MISSRIAALFAVLWLTGCATGLPSQWASPTSAPNKSEAPSAATEEDAIALKASSHITRPSSGVSQDGSPQTPLTTIDLQQSSSRQVAAVASPVDLWDRIRRSFAMPALDSDLVRDREQWYANRPDYIFRMTERSKKYLFHIVEELELRNMPTELALLPFVESAFNPQAVSVAKAAGMWQFMPATGKFFDLKQNAFRDDRRDVLASTRAALDYLQKLHGMFGDWHLALAAYNWGEGSVARAIAKNQRLGQPTGYANLNMPMETRFYVPKLLAIKNIVARPDAFNSKLPQIDNHPYFQSVTIHRDIDVTLAARLAGISLEDFKALNPSVNRPVILAGGISQILLPWDNAEVFQGNLEAYGGGRLASWTVWVAPTTMRPADAAKRVGMSESELRSVNAIPPRVVIRAGSTLLVPRSNRVSADVTSKVADTGQLSLAPEVALKRTVVRASKGETVNSIARKYRSTVAQVAQWNKVAVSASFKTGQQVVLFLPSASRKKTAATPSRSVARKPTSVSNSHRHPVGKR